MLAARFRIPAKDIRYARQRGTTPLPFGKISVRLNGRPHNRVAVVIGKHILPLATKRNRVRRAVYAAATYIPNLAADIVITVTSTPPSPPSLLRSALITASLRASR